MELVENMSVIRFSISNFRKMDFEELGLIEGVGSYIACPFILPQKISQKFK